MPQRKSVKAPERIETARLILYRPGRDDASEIFSRYASDPGVTAYMSFSTHRTQDDAHAFLSASEAEWERWPAGPYLMRLRAYAVFPNLTSGRPDDVFCYALIL